MSVVNDENDRGDGIDDGSDGNGYDDGSVL